MAAPPEVTIKNLSGRYSLNKTLSDDGDAFFTLQNFQWLTRKAMNLATISLTLKKYEEDGVVHIDIEQVSTLSTTNENRTLDWTDRETTDKVFGKVRARSRITSKASYEPGFEVSAEDRKFLLGEVLKDDTPSAFVGDDEHVQALAVNLDPGYEWTVDQLWGFEEVDGVRRYTRRLLATRDGKTERMRFVYDYLGTVESGDDDLAY